MPNTLTHSLSATGPGTEEGLRPTIVPGPVAASSELTDRPRRRTFTAADKLRILAEIDVAAGSRGIGAVLRREGLYSSILTDWRQQRDAGAYEALGLSRASVHRRRTLQVRPPAPPRPRPKPPRALTAGQRLTVLDLMREPRFVDPAPAEIYADLLDQGVYHCSIRTMYRILGEHHEVRERRRQLRHPIYQKPELLALGPNQVRSWDITKLMGPVKWTPAFALGSVQNSSVIHYGCDRLTRFWVRGFRGSWVS